MCKEEHRLFHPSLTNTLPSKGQQCVCGGGKIEQLNCEGHCATMQLSFYQSFPFQKHKAFLLLFRNHLPTVKIQSVHGSLLLQHSMQRLLPVSWCGLGMMDVVGFQPVDLVKSLLPPFLLASLASVIHKSSSFIDASVLHCKSLLSLLGDKALS